MFTIYSADVTGNPGNCSYPHKRVILDAGIFAATTSAAGKEDDSNEEVLELEESDTNESGDAGNSDNKDTIPERNHRRRELV